MNLFLHVLSNLFRYIDYLSGKINLHLNILDLLSLMFFSKKAFFFEVNEQRLINFKVYLLKSVFFTFYCRNKIYSKIFHVFEFKCKYLTDESCSFSNWFVNSLLLRSV